MTAVTPMVVLGINIGLFVITLIIIFALRKTDQNTRRLSNVKKLVEKLDADTRKTMEEFKQGLAEIEVEISRKEDNLRTLIQTGTTQINNLSSYYDDFSNLSSAMQTYRKALEGVQRLTESTDDKIHAIDDDVARLEEVKQLIEAFRDDVDNIRQAAIEQVEKAASDADQEIDGAVESLKSESAIMKESFRTDVATLVDSNSERIKNVVDTCVEEINDRISQMNQISAKLAAQQAQIELLESQHEEAVAEAVADPVVEEPKADISVDTQFDIQDIEYNMEPEPIPQPEPESEVKPRSKFEYTGEDEEVIFS